MFKNEIWLSLNDYSSYRDISISTIRRYIKNNQVKYKKEKGKYFIFVNQENYQKKQDQKENSLLSLKMHSEELKKKIKILEEENNDLKMLVQLYENQFSQKPPTLPPDQNKFS